MSVINILDRDTINKIAAGEVIEGAYAVVKELVENSIDAGADSVTVELRDDIIRVTDNGSGILRDDVRKAFLPHSTSKIKIASDLLRVSSLGFRGEALASIASVSEVEVLTKTEDELSGIRYKLIGGEEEVFEEVGTPTGTTIIVSKLFFNTPARRKFLKSERTEQRYVVDVIEHLALSNKNVSLKLIINSKIRIQTMGATNLKDVIYYIYGKEIAKNLIEVDVELGGFHLGGLIALPSFTRGNREYENYFVNGRYIKNKIITKAIEEAYKPYIMQHRYPFTCLFIEVDRESVDVNVHPAKLEVRFSDTESLYKIIYKGLTDALKNRELIQSIDEDTIKEQGSLVRNFEKKEPQVEDLSYNFLDIRLPEPFEKKKSGSLKPIFEIPIIEEDTPQYETKEIIEDKKIETKFEEQKFLDYEAEKEIKIIGQIFKTYIVAEYESKVYLIDQHAAHEKILYEKFMKEISENNILSQNIMPKQIIKLSSSQVQVIEEVMEHLVRLGFEIEHFGGSEYVIKAVPSSLFGLGHKELLFDILDNYTKENKNITPDTMLSKLATMACKAAIKGNDYMSEIEIRGLVRDLMKLENPYNCPHGRPTMISMSKTEIEKKFKRIL